jgi:hypothetical protein
MGGGVAGNVDRDEAALQRAAGRVGRVGVGPNELEHAYEGRVGIDGEASVLVWVGKRESRARGLGQLGLELGELAPLA